VWTGPGGGEQQAGAFSAGRFIGPDEDGLLGLDGSPTRGGSHFGDSGGYGHGPPTTPRQHRPSPLSPGPRSRATEDESWARLARSTVKDLLSDYAPSERDCHRWGGGGAHHTIP
jgi:hypothetical protein